MARRNESTGPNDVELLTRVGLVPTTAASTSETVISIPERAAHLCEVLNQFDSLVLVEDDIRQYNIKDWRESQQEQFGRQAAYEMYARKRQKHQELEDSTKQEFYSAYGLGQLLDAAPSDNKAVRTDADKQYIDFTRQFRGSTEMRLEKRRLMRNFFRQQLVGTTAASGVEVTKSEPEPFSSETEETVRNREYAKADTKVKLEGLRDDTRAGFLPTTHREKSQGYELLSYMEPGRYEKGVSTRLDEIFFRQQREMHKAGRTPHEGYKVAVDSVRSVVREWGDYLADSRSSWKKLYRLGKLIDETPSPRLTLEEMLNDEGQGETLAQLIRYSVLRKYRDGEELPGFDPLWVREDRTNPTEEKHKTVEDMFTHQGEEFMAAYIRRRTQQMTVGEVRVMVVEAIHDQEKRGKFWHTVLESLNEDYQQYASLALQQSD